MGNVAELGETKKEINIICTIWVFVIADVINHFRKVMAGCQVIRCF